MSRYEAILCWYVIFSIGGGYCWYRLGLWLGLW
jgi:hypothetical protein